jgi:hypothetical protein
MNINKNNVINDAVANIAATSQALEKYCNAADNHNSYSSQLLERMAWELHKQANELKEINYRYGV